VALAFSHKRSPDLRVTNQSKGTAIADCIKVADTSLTRFVGLLGNRTLSPGSGLWIVPSNGVHTIGMMFAIDVLFVDGKHHVVGIRKNLRPFRITKLNWRARSVLELPIGTIQASQTEIGDQLLFEQLD